MEDQQHVKAAGVKKGPPLKDRSAKGQKHNEMTKDGWVFDFVNTYWFRFFKPFRIRHFWYLGENQNQSTTASGNFKTPQRTHGVHGRTNNEPSVYKRLSRTKLF